MQRIQHYLELDIIENATFISELLCNEVREPFRPLLRCPLIPSSPQFPGENSRFMLAKCFFRTSKPQKVVQCLQGCSQPEHRYLYALACLQLSRLRDAENALTRTESWK